MSDERRDDQPSPSDPDVHTPSGAIGDQPVGRPDDTPPDETPPDRAQDGDAPDGGAQDGGVQGDGAPETDDGERRPDRPAVDVVLAIDIGGTKFAAGLVTPRGELIDRARVEVPKDALPEQHWDNLASICRQQLDRARSRHHARVRAIGVGSAGPVTRDVETVSPLNIAAWRGFPLRTRLSDAFAKPVYGDLDAKALALAEGWLGAAQGHANFCALTVSTGVGGGVILDGELLDGNSGNAGHIGHVIVEPGGRRCECGARGCLEAEASGLAIEAITGRPPTEPTYEIMQRTGRLVGRAAATVCNSLDLSLVVVGGSVALGFAATFFHSAQLEMDEHARTPYSRGARITPSRLGDSGPLIGAGAVGWRGVRRARRSTPRRAAVGRAS